VPPSVRTVTELPGLGLTLLAGPDGRDRPVRWVAVSELEDPTPFLEGGEILLTTGMRLPVDQPGVLVDYVDRLVDAGVAALGIGIGLTHDACPPGLVQAALKIPFVDRIVLRASAGLSASHPAQTKLATTRGPAAFICVGQTCSLPVTSPDQIAPTVAAVRR